jgi:hypothetical protein
MRGDDVLQVQTVPAGWSIDGWADFIGHIEAVEARGRVRDNAVNRQIANDNDRVTPLQPQSHQIAIRQIFAHTSRLPRFCIGSIAGLPVWKR